MKMAKKKVVQKQSKPAEALFPAAFGRFVIVGILGLLGVIAVALLIPPDPYLLLNGRIKLAASKQWSAKERDKLRTIIAESYPLVVKYSGEPLERLRLTVKKIEGSSCYANVSFNLDWKNKRANPVMSRKTLELTTDRVFKYPSVVAHELAHLIRGRRMIFLYDEPTFDGEGFHYSPRTALEEGLAEAVANLVRRDLNYPPTDNHQWEVSPGFDKPALQFIDSYGAGHPRLHGIRLELMAHYLQRWEAENPGFIRKFNEGIGILPASALPISEQDDGMSIGEKIAPGFSYFYNHRPIFQRAIFARKHLMVFGDSTKCGIILFETKPSGEEVGLAGEMIRFTLDAGAIKRDVTLPTTEDGSIRIDWDVPLPRYTTSVKWGTLSDAFEYGR